MARLAILVGAVGTVLIIVVALAALAALLVVGVGAVASRSRKRSGARRDALLGLAKVRSPSGKPFFPTDDAALELSELLDDVDERRRREGR